MNKIYFIIGVNGVGKSTIIPLLKDRLDPSLFEIHDFDERGVPDSAGSEWRLSETLYWAQVGKTNLEEGRSTIICGYSKPKEIQSAIEKLNVPIEVILLDASGEVITERILGRYTTQESIQELERTTGKTPEKFAQDNVWVSTKFREEAQNEGYMILDTSTHAPNEVAASLIGLF